MVRLVLSAGKVCMAQLLPSELLPIKGDHSIEVEIGGSGTLDDILRSLWRWPDNRRDVDALRRGFLRGVVVLCETWRLLSVSNDVFDRIRLDANATPLSRQSWKRIRGWSTGCTFILYTAGKGHGEVNEVRFRDLQKSCGFLSFQDLVSEIRVLKWQDTLLENYKGQNRQWLERKQPGTEVENPRFDPPGQLE